jgi:hypothetical protein
MSRNISNLESCIDTLQKLLKDTNQLFELPEEQRVALFKAVGGLTRPNRDEFQRRRKDAKKAVKRKMIAKVTMQEKQQEFALPEKQPYLWRQNY